MGITVLPDWGKELGRSLGEAGKGISEMIDPFIDFHTKFTEEAAANPEMIPKLAGQAYVNEGDLGPAEKFIPKKILADIKDRASKGLVPPEFFKRKAGIDVGRMKRDSTGEVTPEEIASLKPAGGFSNQEWYDMGKASIAGESIEGTSKGLAGAPFAKPVATSQAGAEIAKNNLSLVMDKLKGEQLQTYVQYRAGLAPADKQTLDNLDVDEAVRFQARIQADKEMLKARDEAEFNRWSKESDQRMGYWMAEHNGGGDPEDWVRWMHDSKLRDKVKNDVASGQLDDEDRQFSEINRLYGARSARMNSLEITRMSGLIEGAKDRINGNIKKGIKPATEGMRGELLTRLNVDLSAYAATAGTKPIQAFYGNLYDIKSKPLGAEKDLQKKAMTSPFITQEREEEMRKQEKAKENRFQPSGTQTVSPPKPATSEDVINAARARYIVVRDSLTRSGVPLAEAQKRAASVTDSIFNIGLSKLKQP